MKCPITKIENPLRNILAPALIFVIVSKIFGFLIYGKFLMSVWMPFIDLYRPMEQVEYWQFGMTAIDLFFGLLISIIFAKLLVCKNKSNCDKKDSKCCIVGFAIAIFLLSRFVGEIYFFIMFPVTFDVALIGMLHGLLTMVSWALISKKIFDIK